MSKIISKALALAFATLLVASAVFSGAALAAPSPEELADGSVYWDGQDIEYSIDQASNSSWNDGTFEIRTVDSDGDLDSLVAQRVADGQTLTVDSENLGVGKYALISPEDDRDVDFEVVEQSLDVSVDSANVVNDGADADTEFEFDSNRAQFDLVVSVDGLDNDDLDDIFNAHNTRIEDVDEDDSVDEDFVLEDVNADDFAADFDGIDEGEYAFEFSVYDTSASGEVDVTVGDANDGVASFSDGSVMSDYAGEEIVLPISLENTQTATVILGGEDDGYTVEATVTDEDEDGKVVLHFDSMVAGETDGVIDDAFVVADDSEDEVTITSESDIVGNPLDTGSYSVELSVDSRTTDYGVARVMENPAPQFESYVAPGDTAVNYEDLMEAGTESGSVAFEDYNVVKMDLYGYAGYIPDDAEANELIEGSSWSDASGIYFELKEENAGVNSNAEQLDLANAELIQDEDTESLYLVIDPSDFPNAEEDETYEFRMVVTPDNDHLSDGMDADEIEDAEDVEVSAFLTVEEREATIDGLDDDDVNEISADEQNFTGTTTVAPGTELTLVAGSTDDASPFFMSQTVTVDDDRAFDFSFDLSDEAEGAEFEINVADDLSPVYEGAIGASENAEPEEPQTYDLTVNVENEEGDAIDDAAVSFGANSGISGDSFSVEDGTYEVDISADGYEATSTEVTVDGAAEDVTVTLPVEGEGPVDGNETEDDDEGTDTTGPGFGMVIALVAIIGAALLAVRRNDDN
jgi:PGF-CTERM protein